MNARKVMDLPNGDVRIPNPKGQGARLREEIVAAARRLLEEVGSEEAIGLRATARVAGITAPAIYAHFSDRQEMVEAVVASAFEEFAGEVTSAMSGIDDPVERLWAACRAYVAYGLEHPATYRVIFTRHRPSAMPSVRATAAEFFQILIDLLDECHRAGRRGDGDAFEDAVAVWLGMHGLASLPPAQPRFAWPDQDRLIELILAGSGRITAAP